MLAMSLSGEGHISVALLASAYYAGIFRFAAQGLRQRLEVAAGQ
jgi:hypothetical protein